MTPAADPMGTVGRALIGSEAIDVRHGYGDGYGYGDGDG
jgi:hypothetical protein